MENLTITPISEELNKYILNFRDIECDIAFIPLIENGNLLAPIDSLRFFDFLQDNYPNNFSTNKIAIYGNSEEFKFIELHGIIYDIGLFSVKYIFLPILLSIIANYITTVLFKNSSDKFEVSYSLLIEKKDEKFLIKYTGPGEEALKSLDIIKEMNNAK